MRQSLFAIIITVFAISCHGQNNGQRVKKVSAIKYSSEDTIRLNELIEKCKPNSHQPIGQISIQVAHELLNTPYVAATLETDGDEQLVINLREMDCTTFVENVIALSICLKKQHCTFDQYCQTITQLRYRNGVINGYPSRLHYFTEWLVNNQKKKIITIISDSIGNAPFDATVNFMSTHPDKYKQLTLKPELIPEIAKTEALISAQNLKYIPKDQVALFEDKINDGDIIAIATSLAGLDISHVGIAVHVNNRLHFYHASSTEKKVVLSAKPLSEYLAGIKSNTGILVARIKQE